MQQGADVGPIGLDIAVRGIAAGSAVAAQVTRHHPLPRAEKIHLRLPVVVVAGKAVHEDQRGVAVPLSFIEKSCALHFYVWHKIPLVCTHRCSEERCSHGRPAHGHPVVSYLKSSMEESSTVRNLQADAS